MILINPKKDVITTNALVVGMSGHYRVRTINKFSGNCRLDTGWFDNKLLASGLNAMATEASWLTHCQVGTDNTLPSDSDTSLLGYVSGTSDIQSTTNGQQGASPYYGWKRHTYRFAAGTVAANLSEVGVGWGSSGSTLVSRALIIDPVTQNPTTITPLSDELLDVTYELRYYPPTSDVSGPQVTLDGVVYDTTTRAAEVTSTFWSANIGTKIGHLATALSDWAAYDGTLGTIRQNPNGVAADCDTSTLQYDGSYSNNSFEMMVGVPVGISGWNLAGGIRSIRIRTTAGSYQTEFSSNPGGSTIPKDTLHTMNMQWIVNWSEKT
jgi:hypothetical protein